MPTLTAEHRSLGGKAAAQQRRADKAELLKLREWFNAQPANKPDQQPEAQKPDPGELLLRTREHIDAIDKLMSDCTDPKAWDCLTRSREREWRIFAHLSNLPGPGNLKPSSRPAAQSRRTIAPVGVDTTQPAPMPASNQDEPKP